MKKKEPRLALAYRIINGELVVYHVRNNRSTAPTAYLIRRADQTEGPWFGTRSEQVYFTIKEAKQKALTSATSSIAAYQEWLKQEKEVLKKIKKIKETAK